MILVLKRFRQPYLLAYILAGLLLGPSFSGVFGEAKAIEDFGMGQYP
jgi:monovalent cation:H+ antiporter-2, CPA2 family